MPKGCQRNESASRQELTEVWKLWLPSWACPCPLPASLIWWDPVNTLRAPFYLASSMPRGCENLTVLSLAQLLWGLLILMTIIPWARLSLTHTINPPYKRRQSPEADLFNSYKISEVFCAVHSGIDAYLWFIGGNECINSTLVLRCILEIAGRCLTKASHRIKRK